MARVEAQPAFLLHARAYRETSLLLEVLTRDHGRVGLVARGVRSRRARVPRAVLEPLAALELSWSGRGELGTLASAEILGQPLALGADALPCALYLNELVARLLPRHDPHPLLFERYAHALVELSQGAAPHGWTLRRFERDVLAELGYALQLEVDAEDGTDLVADSVYAFDPERGAVRRERLPGGIAVSGAALRALAGDAVPDAALLRELRRMMREVLRHQLGGRELNAWRLLDRPAPGPARG